jgi:diguanylate cyclase (GGDEF)-like protein/PAS domain S-box-containing protein
MAAVPHPSFNEFIDLLLDAICVVDQEGRYVYVSAGFERIFGYAPAEVIGRRMIELVHPDDRERTLKTAGGIMAGDPQYHFENRYVRKDGRVVDIMWSARWSEQHRLRIAVARDITRRKRAETIQAALYSISEATHAAEDLRTLFEQIHRIIGELLPARNFSIALYDEKSGAISFPYHVDDAMPHPAPHRLHSDTPYAEVIRGGQALLLSPGDDGPADSSGDSPASARDHGRSWLGVPLEAGHRTIGALVVQSKAGDAHYTPDDQDLLQFVSTQVASAIERTQMIAGLQHAALYDPLTRLPNRDLFHDRMQLALARVRRDPLRLSLLYLDLDKFKAVNDSFGHGIGDLLLQKVARRLEACVRAGDTVARFGGDEFVVLLENIGAPEHTTAIVDKIRAALEKPFDLEGREVTVLASVGVAHYPLHGADEAQLLRHADEDMYRQKKRQ